VVVRLKICFVTEDAGSPPDEGLKKFVVSTGEALRSEHDVLVLSTRASENLIEGVEFAGANRLMMGNQLGRRIRKHQPDILVYVPRASATRNAFLRLAAIRLRAPSAVSMMVSLQARQYGRLGRRLVRLLRPDVMVTQSMDQAETFKQLGLNVRVLPSGVDTARFRPIDDSQRSELRAKYGFSAGEQVVLHAGHLTPERNLGVMVEIAQKGFTSVVVASSFLTRDASLAHALRAEGVRVIDTYVERVEELYQIADCYIFPVRQTGGAIEMPLSVLEALSTGLPVVTTRFGALTHWLPSTPGLTYVDTDQEMISAVERIVGAAPQRGDIAAGVARFAWRHVAQDLIQLQQPSQENSHELRRPRMLVPTWETRVLTDLADD
jgi:glycosyltransferase involved in cell wall biosynthesis